MPNQDERRVSKVLWFLVQKPQTNQIKKIQTR